MGIAGAPCATLRFLLVILPYALLPTSCANVQLVLFWLYCVLVLVIFESIYIYTIMQIDKSISLMRN